MKVVISLFFFLSFSLWANTDRQARAIADQLRCPVCRGIPISESPAELAQDMMKTIRAKLVEGQTEEEILKYFEDRYGEWILLKPKPKGLNLMIWIFPFVVFVGGIGVLSFAVVKWSHQRNPEGKP